ncbi:MAG: 2-C-methyl-D-erythritol 4-phosphate cytidylyltransferase [Tannerella sp.]|jgi:2-C-methyl-D-erythritol 4-phosphate cytidylyltransferase|nr:2-C-methyl-D-erythritol 4-phosphate cytidylyltransferase [Tannerella sp.]
MKCAVIIVAGGRGVRMGSRLPKQFLPLCGKPLLMHTLEVFHRWNADARLMLALPEMHRPYWEMLCRELDWRVPHRVTPGGETRFHSVRNALAAVDGCDWVGVHDGVRPLVAPEVIEACFRGAVRHGAALPAVPVAESLRECDGERSRAVDRTRYRLAQTPQVFRRDWLEEAYRQPYSPLFTDDASVVEAAGRDICLVPGNPENIKITTPADLLAAEKWLDR